MLVKPDVVEYEEQQYAIPLRERLKRYVRHI